MNPDFDPAVDDVDYILDEARDSGELPKPKLLKCANPKCGKERPAHEMARVWAKDGYFPLCHPLGLTTELTCFDKWERGHALYGEPVNVLRDRVPGGAPSWPVIEEHRG